MKTLLSTLSIPLFAFMAAHVSFAQGDETFLEDIVQRHAVPGEGVDVKEVQDACATDIKNFCSNVTPGEGRVAACLKAYSDKISDTCKEAVRAHVKARKEKVRQLIAEAKVACKDDIDRLCKDEQTTHKQVMACLEKNQNLLSTGCSQKRTELIKMFGGQRNQ